MTWIESQQILLKLFREPIRVKERPPRKGIKGEFYSQEISQWDPSNYALKVRSLKSTIGAFHDNKVCVGSEGGK